jgi:hypothetical protein
MAARIAERCWELFFSFLKTAPCEGSRQPTLTSNDLMFKYLDASSLRSTNSG